VTAPPAFAVSAQRPTPRAQPPVTSPRPLGRLLPRVRPYLWRLLIAFVCLLLSAGIALAFPQIVRHLLDAAFISANGTLLNKIAIGLLILFAVNLQWFPSSGFTSVSSLVLPTVTIVVLQVALISRLVRREMSANLGAPYVTIARSRGVSERRLTWRYASPTRRSPSSPRSAPASPPC